MKYIGSVLAGVLFVTAVVALRLEGSSVSAQKAERGTQRWTITVPATELGQYVHVFDMSGVCLYVFEPYGSKGGGIAAIAKTQLPQGTGCQ